MCRYNPLLHMKHRSVHAYELGYDSKTILGGTYHQSIEVDNRTNFKHDFYHCKTLCTIHDFD